MGLALYLGRIRISSSLRQCLPEPLRDGTFSSLLVDDSATNMPHSVVGRRRELILFEVGFRFVWGRTANAHM